MIPLLRKSSWLLLLAGLLLLSLGLRLIYAQKFAFDYDEGHWLMFAVLSNQGHTPYTETFVGIPPLALLTNQLAVFLFGPTLSVRIPMLLYSLVGVAALYALVSRQLSPLAGLLAATYLSFQFEYFSHSTTIMTEVPAVAMALLSLTLADYYRTRPSAWWLALSGAAFAASLMLKLFVLFVPVIIAAQILSVGRAAPIRTEALRTAARLGVAWLAGGIITAAALLLNFDVPSVIHQTLEFRIALREVRVSEGFDVIDNLVTAVDEWEDTYLTLSLGAVAGLALLRRRAGAQQWLWLLWLNLAILLLLWQIPLRPRYLVMLLPPLAALSGMASTIAIEAADRWVKSAYRPWLTTALASGLLVTTLTNPAAVLSEPSDNLFLDSNDIGRLGAANFVRRISAVDECIVVDDQRFAFLINRLVPPFLSETSTARLDVGWLNGAQIINEARQANCSALVYISNRFDEFTPDLHDKATALFSLKLILGDETNEEIAFAYAGLLAVTQAPDIPLNQPLGDEARLIGADLAPSSWRAGQEISLSTYWQAQREMSQDYKIFIHLKDQHGATVASFDHYPFETTQADQLQVAIPNVRYRQDERIEEFKDYPARGLLPTRLWIPGHTIRETLSITLPDHVPPGSYTLSAGLYDEATGRRLPVPDNQPGGVLDEIVIGTVQVN